MCTMTNCDKIFKSVIEEESLVAYGDYNPFDCTSVYDALDDDNLVVATVAKIVYYQSQNHSNKEIYTEVSNFLKDNV